ncbi:bifunctional histidinol-phosphatase/imidazoleglycerol-phosphate dehydratase HisB [bacterium]|nr:bifunctional histidinol-phosphatase/imidazoleglycerol-phosphate dehydratase HisB [bacterium]
MKKVVFVDRDGTIVVEPPDQQLDSLEKMEFVHGIIEGLRLLSDAGFHLVMVTNQDGLGSKQYPYESFHLVQQKILNLLKGEGICFERVFVCPHSPEDGCRCRKPLAGSVGSYLKRNDIDFQNSFVMGDRETDVELASNLGVRAVRLTSSRTAAEYKTRDALAACKYIAQASRSATVTRKTKETNVWVRVALDGSGNHRVDTGIKFFDHMLSQLSRHSRIDMQISAVGDIEVDEHHTVEDVGIVLGEAMRKALGDKKGIERFGFTTPLDEALAQVAIDLSGRSHLTFRCDFRRERIGDLPSELLEDFFKAFADGLGAGLHVKCSGRNDHHKAEAIFKSTARALKLAVRVDEKALSEIPSTKGAL